MSSCGRCGGRLNSCVCVSKMGEWVERLTRREAEWGGGKGGKEESERTSKRSACRGWERWM